MVRRPQTVYGGRPASIGFNDSSFEACQQFRLSRAVRKIRATGDLLEIGVISIITGKLAVAQGSSTERGHGKKVLVIMLKTRRICSMQEVRAQNVWEAQRSACRTLNIGSAQQKAGTTRSCLRRLSPKPLGTAVRRSDKSKQNAQHGSDTHQS